MKIALSIQVILALIICAYFVYLSMTDEEPNTDLVDGKLRPCAATPNCVSSETEGEKFVEPLVPDSGASLDKFWKRTISEITDMGGEIKKQDDIFVWATFQSKLFRFTDDVELRKDVAAGVIQIRSSSRSGKSDLGVNRKRVEALRAKLESPDQ